MENLRISLYLLSLILISKTHFTFSLNNPSFNPDHPLTTKIDVHDLLPQYGLPRGLLPNNVKSYTLSSTGAFEIELSSHQCYVRFADKLVYFEKVIKGNLKYGSVSDISGIQAKQFFLWVSVSKIEVSEGDKNQMNFFAGPIYESLPVSVFAEIPVCKSKAVSLLRSIDSM